MTGSQGPGGGHSVKTEGKKSTLIFKQPSRWRERKYFPSPLLTEGSHPSLRRRRGTPGQDGKEQKAARELRGGSTEAAQVETHPHSPGTSPETLKRFLESAAVALCPQHRHPRAPLQGRQRESSLGGPAGILRSEQQTDVALWHEDEAAPLVTRRRGPGGGRAGRNRSRKAKELVGHRGAHRLRTGATSAEARGFTNCGD